MELEKLGNKFIEDVKKRSISAGQKVTGRTLASLKVIKINDNHIQIEGFDYIGTLEVGRKGGKIPYNFKQILIDWAKAKGITFSSDAQRNSWAWFTAKKIARQGTQRNKNPQDIFTTPLADLTKEVERQASIFYEEKIINSIYTK